MTVNTRLVWIRQWQQFDDIDRVLELNPFSGNRSERNNRSIVYRCYLLLNIHLIQIRSATNLSDVFFAPVYFLLQGEMQCTSSCYVRDKTSSGQHFQRFEGMS